MNVIWKTEGPTDLLALISLGLPDGHTAICTANGAQERPQQWMLELFRDAEVNVIHDADKPGQEGATWVESKNSETLRSTIDMISKAIISSTKL